MPKIDRPVRQGTITQFFGENVAAYARFGYCCGHNGVDYGVPTGTAVLAAMDGRVDKVAYEAGGYGNYIVLRHADGWLTYYAHLSNRLVNVGDTVSMGDTIAESGNTGNSTRPHLHFSLRRIGENTGMKGYVDPLPYMLAQPPVVTPPPITTTPPPVFQPELPDNVKPGGGNWETAAHGLRVRTGPGQEYPEIGYLPVGAKLTALRQCTKEHWIEFEPGKWCATRHNGQELCVPDGN